jgi:hypothetical protein
MPGITVVVAALIDAGCTVMRLLGVVGLSAWQDDNLPSAEAARGTSGIRRSQV